MKVVPFHNHVLVELIEISNESEGGLIIPDASKEKPRRGIILSIGIEAHIGISRVGNHVLIKKWGGTEIDVDGKHCLLIEDTDILGAIE